MRRHLKDFFVMFLTQVVMYGLITYNWRMIAQAKIPEALVSDAFYGGLNFFVIRKIARDNDTFIPWLGYLLGGVLGTYLGIHISMMLHWR